MTRLRRMTRDVLDDDQRLLFDQIAEGEHPTQRPAFRRLGADNALEGPYNARLLNPALGRALFDLAMAVRYQTQLSDRVRELVILTVSGAVGSAYQTRAHLDIGRAVGLRDEELELVVAGRPMSLEGEEQAAVEVTRALVSTGDLDDDAYAAAVEVLGERGLFEVLTLAGCYLQTAMQLRVFRVEPPEE